MPIRSICSAISFVSTRTAATCIAGVMLLQCSSHGGVLDAQPGSEARANPFDNILSPGKIDFTYRHLSLSEEHRYNAFLWTPIFKGGGGAFVPRDGNSLSYGGGFFRPLAAFPERGDLIIGAHYTDSRARQDHEFQAEYRFPFGLGIGGGYVDSANPATDVKFGKLTYRNKAAGWNYILEAQVQEFGDTTSAGGYAALYNDQFMVVGGSDGEQWRITGGYIAPESSGKTRIAAEVLYVDNSIGDHIGPRNLFANMTLKYEGGFLSNPARLGRAMGPQGLEYGNPLGFLIPTWNRRLEVWELGKLGGLRAERTELPDDSVTERYEALVFPFQLMNTGGFLDGIFVGGAYLSNPKRDTPSVLGGYFGGSGAHKVFLGAEYECDPEETSIVFGFIHTF